MISRYNSVRVRDTPPAAQSPRYPRRWIDEEALECNYQRFTEWKMAKAMRQLERARRRKSGMEPARQKRTINGSASRLRVSGRASSEHEQLEDGGPSTLVVAHRQREMNVL